METPTGYLDTIKYLLEIWEWIICAAFLIRGTLMLIECKHNCFRPSIEYYFDLRSRLFLKEHIELKITYLLFFPIVASFFSRSLAWSFTYALMMLGLMCVAWVLIWNAHFHMNLPLFLNFRKYTEPPIPDKDFSGYVFYNEGVFHTILIRALLSPPTLSIWRLLCCIIGLVAFNGGAHSTHLYTTAIETSNFHSDFFHGLLTPRPQLSELLHAARQDGFLSRFVTGPHLFCRIIQWWGFFLICQNMITFSHAYMVTCYCVCLAIVRHKWVCLFLNFEKILF